MRDRPAPAAPVSAAERAAGRRGQGRCREARGTFPAAAPPGEAVARRGAALPGSLEEKRPGSHAARQGKGCGAGAVAGGVPVSPCPLTAGSLQVRAALLALLLLLPLPLRPEAARAPKQRPARTRSCGERPEELLEQLYGRLAAGMLSAFHHTLQPEPPGRQHNASCPAGARPPADRRVRLPVNLRSASPWAYR